MMNRGDPERREIWQQRIKDEEKRRAKRTRLEM
jgi:hypothetical protein